MLSAQHTQSTQPRSLAQLQLHRCERIYIAGMHVPAPCPLYTLLVAAGCLLIACACMREGARPRLTWCEHSGCRALNFARLAHTGCADIFRGRCMPVVPLRRGDGAVRDM